MTSQCQWGRRAFILVGVVAADVEGAELRLGHVNLRVRGARSGSHKAASLLLGAHPRRRERESSECLSCP